jgi:hypothetical protein
MRMRCPFAQRAECRLQADSVALCACGQALLLMGVLFCVGKDGNRAAGKMLNRRARSDRPVTENPMWR